ncbi:MAG: hypothetical protein GX221_07895 [Candidatus Riflebacteria bacterium]|nr:hypothetical protein [Candidatus Riflebacteria bacterium]
MTSGALKATNLSEIPELLNSSEALDALEQNVFWPKWQSPWWFLNLLDETDKLEDVSPEVIKSLLDSASRHYIKEFPVGEELDGTDPAEIMCFCLLGGLMRICSKFQIDVFAYLPWAKPWIGRYQLADGGYDCDDTSYIRSGAGSMASTTMMLEGMIEYAKSCENKNVFAKNIQNAAIFLLKRRFLLDTDKNKRPDKNWDKVIFPKFTEYDFTRGLSAVFGFLELSGKKIKNELLKEAIELLSEKIASGLDNSEVYWIADVKTISHREGRTLYFEEKAYLPPLIKKLSSKSPNGFVLPKLKSILAKYEELRTNGQIID